MKPRTPRHQTPDQDIGRLLAVTPLLDYGSATVQRLVADRAWQQLDPTARIGAAYDYVRNEIPFGYNAEDNVAASAVLADGYGQCNTKATLLMALLRAAGIPCRFHAATIHKRLQRGVLTGLTYRLAPKQISHSWAEVYAGGNWKRLEGVILDDAYLDGLRHHLAQPSGKLIGYAVGTDAVERPRVDWSGDHTEIQMAGVERDRGVYDDPDSYYRSAGTGLSGLRRFLFRILLRHAMNRRVASIRAGATPGQRTSKPSRRGRSRDRPAG